MAGKVALCVGINYVGEGVDKRIPALHFAEKDAQDMAALLAGRGFQATTLLGAKATRKAIHDALTDLAGEPVTLCVLYFSGHGMHSKDLLDAGRAYFAPFDFDPDNPMNSLPILDLAQAFEGRFQAQNVFALFDCCYAGILAQVAINPNLGTAEQEWREGFIQDTAGITPRALAQPDAPAPGDSGAATGRAIIAACPADAPAREFAALEHGIVTYYALEAWSGKIELPENGQLTDGALYIHINAKLRERQLPQLLRAAQYGDVILDQFPRPAAMPEAAPAAPAWPGDCRLIDAAAIAAAQAQASYPGALSMYARPGYQAFWHIVAGQDVRRAFTDQVLQAIKAVQDEPGMRFQLIAAQGGNGKSVFLQRLQYELAQAGEYVLVPASDEHSLDPLALDRACRAAAAADPARPHRRVYLLIDRVYHANTPLLGQLMAYPIDNLTILAGTQFTDLTPDRLRPAPALPVATADPTAPATLEPAVLPDLTDAEAQDLVARVRGFGKLQTQNPEEVLRWVRAEGMPLLLALLALTSPGGLDGALDDYTAWLLAGINNGQDPTTQESAQWAPFMHIYYAVALCSAWGASVPQSVLPALTGLTAAQVSALLCSGDTPSGMAAEYLRGRCGGAWRTDHQLIADAALRRLVPDALRRDLLVTLLDNVAANPTADGAALVGFLLHRFAFDPDLIRNELLEPGASTGADETLTAALGEPESQAFAAALAEPQIAGALECLRRAATVADLLVHYGPAYVHLGNWPEVIEIMTAVLANSAIPLIAQAQALAMRGIAQCQLGHLDAAQEDLALAVARSPADPLPIFGLAMLHSLRGDLPAALQYLAAAIQANPACREAARTNPALAAVRATPDFAVLVAGPPAAAAGQPVS